MSARKLMYHLDRVKYGLEFFGLGVMPIAMGGFWLVLSAVGTVVSMRGDEPIDPSWFLLPVGSVVMMCAGGWVIREHAHARQWLHAVQQMSEAGTPWRADPEWEAGRIVYKDSLGAPVIAGLIGIGVVVGALLMPMFIDMKALTHRLSQLSGRQLLAPGALGLWIVLGLGGWAVYAIRAWGTLRRRLTFGASTLVLQTVPGRPGDELVGTVLTPIERQSDTEFVVCLSCFEYRTTFDASGGTHSSWHVVETSRETALLAGEPDPARGHRLRIPFRFALPADAPPTELVETEEQDRRAWRVTVDTGDERYHAEWDVPVFRATTT